MRLSPPPCLVAACLCLALSTGCRAGDRGVETASRDTTDTANAGSAGRHADAIPLTTASGEARALYLRGRDLADQLRAHDARQLFEQAAATDPGFALAHYQLALNSASPKEFLAHLDRAVALSAKASDGERLMIQALQAGVNGDSKKSLEYNQQLVDKYPRDARGQTLLGVAYSGRQEYDKAVAQLTKATALDPNYAPAYNVLGYAYMPQGKYAEAETAFKKYIALVPNDPNPYDSYAEMLMRTGRFDESIAQYRKALSVDPHFTSSFIGVASNLMFQGKYDEALTQADKLTAAARDNADRRAALLSRTVTYVDQGRTAQSIGEMQKLSALDASTGDTAALSGDAGQMGDILLGGGRPDEARTHYQQSLALMQRSGLSAELKDFATLADHYNRARIALAKGDAKTARAEAEQYVNGAEATGDVGRIRTGHELAGMVALQAKDFGKAADELGQADQQDPYVLYTMATAYQGKGDGDKARALAKQAAEMHILPTIRYALVRAKATKME
jgi:tetratricopeptide (TPR) repeat protein